MTAWSSYPPLARAHELAAGTECRILVPVIHETAGLLAEALGDDATRDAERGEALRLYRALGADGHAERLAGELGVAGTPS
jgi:hypothetical protein